MVDKPDLAVPLRNFDWLVYIDGTLAGLAVLIPLPIVDSALERLFVTRMPITIAWRNGRSLSRPVLSELGRSRSGCLQGCLTMPFTLTFGLIKKLSRKILYFLSVKEAADQLGHYWHRAFLIDYAMRRGDLDHLARAQIAAQAIHELLAEITTSPLTQLAIEVIRGVPTIFLTILRWMRLRKEDAALAATRERMATAWSDFDGYFHDVAWRYEAAYARIQAERAAAQEALRLAQQARADAGQETI